MIYGKEYSRPVTLHRDISVTDHNPWNYVYSVYSEDDIQKFAYTIICLYYKKRDYVMVVRGIF